MSTKTKTPNKTQQLSDFVQQAGFLLMTAAVTVGMLELPNHPNSRIALPNRPALAFANDNEELNNPLRREREEAAPHYISYSEVQRTPSRSGRH
jgi:hypothetical protein